jgi:hypothetical protein
MFLNTLWQQTLATALASSRERGASTFGAHARAKTVLLFSSALGRLKSAFHSEARSRGTIRRAAKLETRVVLSIFPANFAHPQEPSLPPRKLCGITSKL